MNHKSAIKGQDTTKTHSDHTQYIFTLSLMCDQDFTPNVTMAVLEQFVTHDIIILTALLKLPG